MVGCRKEGSLLATRGWLTQLPQCARKPWWWNWREPSWQSGRFSSAKRDILLMHSIGLDEDSQWSMCHLGAKNYSSWPLETRRFEAICHLGNPQKSNVRAQLWRKKKKREHGARTQTQIFSTNAQRHTCTYAPTYTRPLPLLQLYNLNARDSLTKTSWAASVIGVYLCMTRNSFIYSHGELVTCVIHTWNKELSILVGLESHKLQQYSWPTRLDWTCHHRNLI